jgi:hypothetical protein
VQQTLGSHIGRRSNAGIFELTFTAGSKPEIPNFGPTPTDQYIGRLDVPMDDTHRLKVEQPLKHILYVPSCLLKLGLALEISPLQHLGEVASVAVFVDSVAIVGSAEVLEAGDNIGMPQSLDDVEFFPEEMLNPHLFNHLALRHLHCHFFAFLCVFGSIHHRKGALAQPASSFNHIVMHSLQLLATLLWSTPNPLHRAGSIKLLDG